MKPRATMTISTGAPMSSRGFTAEIHKVADNGKQLALFLGMAFFFVWVVAINMSVNDLTPRWFQREFEWLSSDSVPPVFLSMALASLISAAGLWLFSGNGDKLYDIDVDGITCPKMFGTKLYQWSDFELLEREVSTLVLHIAASAREGLGPSKLKFDLSHIDCSGPRLEALIVHYRPDLFNTFHAPRKQTSQLSTESPAEPQMAAPAPDAKASQPVSQLSQRIAQLR